MNVKQMKEFIKAKTNQYREKEPVKKPVEHGLAYKIGTILATKSYDKSMAEVFSLITDLDIVSEYERAKTVTKTKTNGVKFLRPFVAVVPLTNFNGHNYPINQVVLLSANYSGNYAGFMANGIYGNSLANATVNTIRLATDKEIDELPDAQVLALINE